jgi:hypothetical protein
MQNWEVLSFLQKQEKSEFANVSELINKTYDDSGSGRGEAFDVSFNVGQVPTEKITVYIDANDIIFKVEHRSGLSWNQRGYPATPRQTWQ